MFRQSNAILRERLFSCLSHFRVNMVGEKSQDIWRNLHTGVSVPSYVLWLVSYHIDEEVAQTGKKSLPEDGITLPKHVGAIVRKNKEIYNFSAFGWLIST
jgi:hypothetical protein